MVAITLQAQSGGGGGASVTTSDAAPSSPSQERPVYYKCGWFVCILSRCKFFSMGRNCRQNRCYRATGVGNGTAPSNPSPGSFAELSVNKLYLLHRCKFFPMGTTNAWRYRPSGPAATTTTYAAVANLPSSKILLILFIQRNKYSVANNNCLVYF